MRSPGPRVSGYTYTPLVSRRSIAPGYPSSSVPSAAERSASRASAAWRSRSRAATVTLTVAISGGTSRLISPRTATTGSVIDQTLSGSAEPAHRFGHPLVGTGEGDPDVLGAGRAVELAGRGQDPQRRQPVDGLPARVAVGDPQVETGLGVVDREPRGGERAGQGLPAGRVPGPLDAHVLLVGERGRHRRLHG